MSKVSKNAPKDVRLKSNRNEPLSAGKNYFPFILLHVIQ